MWNKLKEGQAFYAPNCNKPFYFMFKYGQRVAFWNSRGEKVITNCSSFLPLLKKRLDT